MSYNSTKIKQRTLSALAVISLFCSSNTIFANQQYSSTEQEYNTILHFLEDDYFYEYNIKGELEITAKTECVFPETKEPQIPLVDRQISFQDYFTLKDFEIQIYKRKIFSNVILAISDLQSSTDSVQLQKLSADYYDNQRIYPSSNCEFVTSRILETGTILHFLVSPFIYDAENKELFFIDSINLNINGNLNNAPKSHGIFVDNTKESENENESNSVIQKNQDTNIASIKSFVDNDRIDYLIVSTSNLITSFKPLMKWKKEKGLYAKILTVDEIDKNYQGIDIQQKIKNCLKDLYSNNGLKFVLLGGDDVLVPVRYCYGKVQTYRDNGDELIPVYVTSSKIPTDLYYACFMDENDWDRNQNGIYGELDDDIDWSQQVIVTRVPVRDEVDVISFVEKLLEYEHNPKVNFNILMSGNILKEILENGQSDVKNQADILYKKYIQPYWTGDRFQFFDTFTDFPGCESYDFTALNLQNQLKEGYGFVEISAHGDQTSWGMESGQNYDTRYGKNLKNIHHSIITTVSCNTNAFDNSSEGTRDPCLSESFIRNKESGIVAYLGSSRKGWAKAGITLGASHTFEGKFFQQIFSVGNGSNSFGEAVSKVKESLISYCGTYGTYRWIQFAINPIGDPEMPIWTSSPNTFDNISISLSQYGIKLNTGTHGCKICAMDEVDHGEYYYKVFDNVSTVTFDDLPEEASICITKEGYIPKILKISIIQNKRFSINSARSNDVLILGSNVTKDVNSGPVIIEKGYLKLFGNKIILGDGLIVEKNAGVELIYK